MRARGRDGVRDHGDSSRTPLQDAAPTDRGEVVAVGVAVDPAAALEEDDGAGSTEVESWEAWRRAQATWPDSRPRDA